MAEKHEIKIVLTIYRTMSFLKRLRKASHGQHMDYIKEIFKENHIDPNMVVDVELRHRQNELFIPEADMVVTIMRNPEESEAVMFKKIVTNLRDSPDISVTPCSETSLDLIPGLYFGRSCDIRLQFLSFGTIIKNKFIRHSQCISSVVDDPVASFKLDAQRTMELYFLLGSQLHCMELKYKRDIDTKIIVCSGNASTRIYFQLLLTPKIYIAHDGAFQFSKYQQFMSTNISPQTYVRDEDLGINVKWNRTRDFPGCSHETLGMCTALELRVSDTSCPKDRFMSFFKELMERQYTITFGQFKSSPCNNYTRRWKEIFKFIGNIDSPLAFNVCWALKVLYSRGYIAVNYVENHPFFWITIKKFALEDPKRLELALYKVAGILDDDRYIDIYQSLLECYRDETLHKQHGEVKNMNRIRVCIVTPTRTMFTPPMDLLQNRILLDYDPEYCLRVTYRDDDMNRISAKNSDFYDDIIRTHISNSIKVHTREFEFLACSNSQLRTHGVWFYARDPKGNTAKIIRTKLGDFSGIDCIATFVARMGQCFSSSVRAITSIHECGVELREHDIITEDKKYVFSDGTGRLSPSFAQMLCENLKITYTVLPSLFQIRYGGCKGTVSVDNTLEGNVIVIRDSMAKFKCDKDDLEIVKIAGPSTLHLNHQSIMLLEHHGVPISVFLRLQESAVNTYLEMLFNERTAAHELDACAPMGRGLSHKKLLGHGFSLTTEPYFRRVLKLILHNSLRTVKCEGRIHLPTDMGRNLMGCMDEYRVLEYGEVHVKISPMKSDKDGKVVTLTGPVIITKFPAVHPGDMRRLVAVEKPQLSHLVDCIVFPQKGSRPHSTEMAGSDLDGDEYFVTWLPEFLKNFSKENTAPLDYAPAKKLKLGRNIVATDMYQFISDYIKNDQLGKIANAHKAIGDREGLNDKLAVKLAEKFAVAVDFAKTGECPSLEPEEQIVEYPDFMQKSDVAPVYESHRALGFMYRKVSLLDELLEQSVDAMDDGVNWEQIEYGTIDEKVMKTARDDYRDYCNAVFELTQLYGIQTEAELISGNVTQFNRRFMEKEDMFATSQIVKNRVMKLHSDFRERFFAEFKVNPMEVKSYHIVKEMKTKAAAWHKVSYHGRLQQMNNGGLGERLLSFPWLVADVLCQVIKGNIANLSRSPYIDKLTRSILDMYKRETRIHVGQAPESECESYQHLIHKFPALLPLFFILHGWCVTLRMRGLFLSVVEIFLKDLVLEDIVIDMELLNGIDDSKDGFKECKEDTIGVHKIGQILMAFMKKMGSQDFLSNTRANMLKPIKQSTDIRKLSTNAMRAYFSLSVDNSVNKLVTIDDGLRVNTNKKLCKENTVVIPTEIMDDVFAAEKQIKANFERLADKMDLDLWEVSLNKRRRRKRKVGTLFFRGSHKTVQLLTRVANLWLKDFEKNDDRDYYMALFMKLNDIRY